MCLKIAVVLSILLAGMPAYAAAADELLPVSAILAELADTTAAKDAAAPDSDPQELFMQRVEQYERELPQLSAREACKRWADLFREYMQNKQEPRMHASRVIMPPDLDLLWNVLPGPDAWPLLAADTDASLRLVGAVLTNDRETFWRELQTAATTLPDEEHGYNAEGAMCAVGTMLAAYIATCDDPDSLAAAFALHLQMLENYLRTHEEFGRYGSDGMNVPDLVTAIGPERAAVLLRRALRLPVQFEMETENATRRLARELALAADTPDLGAAQWQLTESPDGFALYERCLRQFRKPENDWQFREAQAYYCLGLAVRGRTDEATAMLERGELGTLGGPVERMVRAGHGPVLTQFLRTALLRKPQSELWDIYASRMLAEGKTSDLISLARQTLADSPSLTRPAMIARYLLQALLAEDRIAEAAALVRLVATWPVPGDSGAARSNQHSGDNDLKEFGQTALQAGELLQGGTAQEAVLGKVMADSGLQLMQPGKARHQLHYFWYRQIIGPLLKSGRLAEAQRFIIAAMRDKANAERDPSTALTFVDEARQLAGIYHRAGQWQQVLALFEQAAIWSDTDLATVLQHDYEREETLYCLADSLRQAGRRDEALQLTRYLLQYSPGSDSAYVLMQQLNPPDLLAYYDELHARDRFEERPLIWKAVALMQRGELAAAEAAVREAIAIDPTDGDQQAGNRVRAYEVLRDVLRLRGDSTATVYASLVDGVRTAEQADRYAAAMLLKRAQPLYQKGLDQFADAYCIQARLAIQLARAGRHDEAAVHFIKAFELLPGQVGRMEDLCFGCGYSFGGETALGYADTVFTRLRREQPQNPRVAYLLGNLRVEQQRPAEAVELFRAAVALDPDYLHAWERLYDLGATVWLPARERQEALLQLVRLNPTGSHFNASESRMTGDPRRIWEMAASAGALAADTFSFRVRQAPKPEPHETENEPARMLRARSSWRMERHLLQMAPRMAVISLPVMQALKSWLECTRQQSVYGRMSGMFHTVIF